MKLSSSSCFEFGPAELPRLEVPGEVPSSSPPIFGVDAVEGLPDLELLRASVMPLLFSGSAECCLLS